MKVFNLHDEVYDLHRGWGKVVGLEDGNVQVEFKADLKAPSWYGKGKDQTVEYSTSGFEIYTNGQQRASYMVHDLYTKEYAMAHNFGKSKSESLLNLIEGK